MGKQDHGDSSHLFDLEMLVAFFLGVDPALAYSKSPLYGTPWLDWVLWSGRVSAKIHFSSHSVNETKVIFRCRHKLTDSDFPNIKPIRSV